MSLRQRYDREECLVLADWCREHGLHRAADDLEREPHHALDIMFLRPQPETRRAAEALCRCILDDYVAISWMTSDVDTRGVEGVERAESGILSWLQTLRRAEPALPLYLRLSRRASVGSNLLIEEIEFLGSHHVQEVVNHVLARSAEEASNYRGILNFALSVEGQARRLHFKLRNERDLNDEDDLRHHLPEAEELTDE
jgi:hypothetical protein